MGDFLNQYDDLFKVAAIFAVSLVTVLTYGALVVKMLNFRREAFKKQYSKFSVSLERGMATGYIKDKRDIENLYLGVSGSGSFDVYDISRLARWLRRFLIDCIGKEKSSDVLRYKQFIVDYIDFIEKQNPNEGLPELERALFNDIAGYINAQDYKSIERKVDQLKTAVQAREDIVMRLRRMNKFAVPLSIVGLMLTALFGVISVLY